MWEQHKHTEEWGATDKKPIFLSSGSPFSFYFVSFVSLFLKMVKNSGSGVTELSVQLLAPT